MNYYNEIKENLINNEIYKKVKDYSKNRSDLDTYYKVGKLLSEAGKHYGEGIIKEYSIKLTNELGKKYSYRSLNYMVKFYEFQKLQPVVANLTWSHYIQLLPLKNIDEINYYIDKSIKNNLSKRELRELIKSKEYERLPNDTKNKLISNDKLEVKDLIPNPIIIRNKNNLDIISEKILNKLIIENIESFMNELGKGFSYIGNEYKIKKVINIII